MNPTAKDVRHVDIAPCFVEKLTHATASYEAPEGEINVSWERESEKISLEISVPDTMYGEIRLPEGYHFQGGSDTLQLKSGKYIVAK